jgi:hypothetical protein
MSRTLSVALALALAAAPFSARAQASLPSIAHEPISKARVGEPLAIRARISTQPGRSAFEPTVFVRVAGIDGYTRIAMKPAPGGQGLFEAQIPAALVAADFDYYLETFDSEGDGPARVGTPETPLRVLVAAAAPPVPPAPKDAPAAARLAPPAPKVDALVVNQQSKPLVMPRSQLPTFLLFAATGVSLGLATFATVGRQQIISEIDRSASGEEEKISGRLYQTGETLGRVSVGGFAAAGVFLTSAIVYLAWPDAESGKPSAGEQP